MTCGALTVSTEPQFIDTGFQKPALGAGTQTHQFLHLTYEASTVNTGPQFIYTVFQKRALGAGTQAHQF